MLLRDCRSVCCVYGHNDLKRQFTYIALFAMLEITVTQSSFWFWQRPSYLAMHIMLAALYVARPLISFHLALARNNLILLPTAQYSITCVVNDI